MIEDDFERAYHKGYVGRTMNVLKTIENLKAEIDFLGMKPTQATIRSIFRKLNQRIKDSGVIKEYPKAWER